MSLGRACGGYHHERDGAASLGAANWLGLAATPSFAVMALLTAMHGGGPADALCSTAHDVSPIRGMVPMYLLMSAFHAAPWATLIAARRTRRPTGS